MSWIGTYLRSSIGGKHLVAVTGAALVLFTIQHMIGNLLVFAGPDALNGYAQGLKDLGALLWIARGGLLALAILHVVRGLSLTFHNRRARPIGYAVYRPVASRFYQRWMAWTGTLLLVFVVFHLLHFTFGKVDPNNAHLLDAQGRHDVYTMVVTSFAHPPLALTYVVAMFFLCAHIAHGATSVFQSLGLRHVEYNPVIDKVGPIAAAILFVGNVSMPLAVLAGLVRLPGGAP